MYLHLISKEAFSQTQHAGSESCWMQPVLVRHSHLTLEMLAQLTSGQWRASRTPFKQPLPISTAHLPRKRATTRCLFIATGSYRASAAERLPLWCPRELMPAAAAAAEVSCSLIIPSCTSTVADPISFSLMFSANQPAQAHRRSPDRSEKPPPKVKNPQAPDY